MMLERHLIGLNRIFSRTPRFLRHSMTITISNLPTISEITLELPRSSLFRRGRPNSPSHMNQKSLLAVDGGWRKYTDAVIDPPNDPC